MPTNLGRLGKKLHQMTFNKNPASKNLAAKAPFRGSKIKKTMENDKANSAILFLLLNFLYCQKDIKLGINKR